MSQRARKWVRRLAVTALVVAVVLLVVYIAVVPRVVGYVLGDVLASLGLSDPRVEMYQVGPSGLHAADITDADSRLSIDNIDVSYDLATLTGGEVDTITLTGVHWVIRIRDGVIDWAPFSNMKPGDGPKDRIELPFARLVLRSSTVTIDWEGEVFRLPVEAVVTDHGQGVIEMDAAVGLIADRLRVSGTIQPDDEQAGRQAVDMTIRGAGASTWVHGSLDMESGQMRLTATAPAPPAEQRGPRGDGVADGPVTLTAAVVNEDGRTSVTVDGRAQVRDWSAQLGGRRYAAELVTVTFGASAGSDQPAPSWSLSAEADYAMLGGREMRQLALRAEESADGLTMQLNAEDAQAMASMHASAPRLGELFAGVDAYPVAVRWDVDGESPQWLRGALQSWGAEILATGRFSFVGDSRLVIRPNGGGGEPGGAWEVELADLTATLDGIDLLLPESDARLEQVGGTVSLSGVVGPRRIELTPGSDTAIGFGAVQVGEGDDAVRIGAVRLAVTEDIGGEPLGVYWSAGGDVRLSLFVQAEQPIDLRIADGEATVGRLALGGVARRSGGDPDEAQDAGDASLTSGAAAEAGVNGVDGADGDDARTAEEDASPWTVRAAIDLEQTTYRSPAQEIAVAGAALHLPLTFGREPIRPGEFTVADITYQGEPLPALTGQAAMHDGEARLSWHWPLFQAAAFTGEAELWLATGGVLGRLQAQVPSFDVTDADQRMLRRLMPPLQDTKLTGRLALDAKMRLGEEQVTPDVRVTATNVGLSSEQYDMAASGITGSVALDSFMPVSTFPHQQFDVASARIGKIDLKDGLVTFEIESPESVFIEKTRWSWGDRGRFWMYALQFDPENPQIDAQVFIEDLALSEWLDVISDGRVSGQGRLFGRVPVTYRPEAQRRLLFGRGYLYTQPEAGSLQMRDTEWVVNTLLNDPQFTKDVTARQLRERVVESLKNFRYEQLAFEFIPREDDLQLKMITTGKGQGPGGISLSPLTVNLNGYDQLLNERLLPQLGSPQAITNALERFFNAD